MLDLIGQIIWFGAFAAPIVAVLFFWRDKELNKVTRIILGLLVGVIVAFLMLGIGLSIAVRDGLGPG